MLEPACFPPRVPRLCSCGARASCDTGRNPRPLPASFVRVVVEVVLPGSDKIDRVDKMAEYADAKIPFYWLVWIVDNHVAAIDVHVRDHVSNAYRLYRTLTPEEEVSVVEVPVRIKIAWQQLAVLVREDQ